MLNMSFPSSQNNTLNLWTKSKSVDLFSHISAPLPYPTKQYAEQTKKIGILSQFCDLPHIDPTR